MPTRCYVLLNEGAELVAIQGLLTGRKLTFTRPARPEDVPVKPGIESDALVICDAERLPRLGRHVRETADVIAVLPQDFDEGVVLDLKVFDYWRAPLKASLLAHSLNRYLEHKRLKSTALAVAEANVNSAMLVAEIEQKNRIISEQQANLVHTSRMGALGEMAGGIAHEINNPLATLQMRAQLLEEILGEPSPDPQDILFLTTGIVTTTERIAHVVQNLRLFSRDARLDVPVKVPLFSVVETAVDLCRERISSAGISLELSIPPALEVSCRSIEISQSFFNLIMNACQAIERLPEKWIRIDAREERTFAVIRVTDSGTGIPEEIREKIFQPFFTTKEIGKGTGLGLSASYGIIQAHGGKLGIDPESRNTCFMVTLPKGKSAPPA